MRKSFGICIVLLVTVIFAGQVSAERGRRASGSGSEPIPQSEKIQGMLGDVEWGWGHEKVIALYTKQVHDVFRPLLHKATDAIREDRLRRQMNARIHRIKNSYVEFEGQHSGWDTSLIRDEYTHNNGEALVEVREIRSTGEDPRYTDYFFFINDHLWRMYRAFNQDQFAGIPFETAAKSFQRRFGPAREKRRGGELVALEWQNDTTRLEAQDNTEFFGVFCLVFSEKATERRLDQLRKNKSRGKRQLNPLVKALEGGSDREGRHQNIVEHITGKRYRTAQEQDAVEGNPERPSKGRPAKSSSGSRNPFEDRPSNRGKKNTGDPLLDLEI